MHQSQLLPRNHMILANTVYYWRQKLEKSVTFSAYKILLLDKHWITTAATHLFLAKCLRCSSDLNQLKCADLTYAKAAKPRTKPSLSTGK